MRSVRFPVRRLAKSIAIFKLRILYYSYKWCIMESAQSRKPLIPEREFLQRVLGRLRSGEPKQIAEVQKVIEARLQRVSQNERGAESFAREINHR